MAWLKRNLFFVLGSAVTLALMGGAVWYLLHNWNLDRQKQQQLDETYDQLQQLTAQNPAPGIAGGKVDNQKTAADQIKQLQEINRKLRERFTPIPAIPNSANVSGVEFGTVLPRTINQLHQAAAAASVTLPPKAVFDYSFSFEAQRPLTRFAPGSLKPLSVQLGEVKAICDVLFAAKINFLASIRREKVSTDDETGTIANYLEEKSTVTDMATLAPYEVTFHCFVPELVAALAGFKNSPYCFVVRSLIIEPVTEVAVSGEAATPGAPTRGGVAAATTTALPGAAVGNRGGLPTFLEEKQMKVVLMLDIVKLK